MENEFDDSSNYDAFFDLMVDQLHHFAELALDEDLDTAWVSSSADRATAF